MANSSKLSDSTTSASVSAETKTLLLIMGPCGVRGCECTSGESVSNSDHWCETKCTRCSHPLSEHNSYVIKPYVSPRHDLINELIRRLERYHLIRVNGTPASGKTTTMKLLANELLERYPDTPLYVLSGWPERQVSAAGGWIRYFEKQLNVRGDELEAYPCFILFDEAQESYWDTDLWAQLFKSIEKTVSVHFVLFTCYGAGMTHGGGGQTLPTPTPINFQLHQQVSLRPEEGIYHHPGRKQVGLLLSENEAYNVLDQYVPSNISNGADILTEGLKRGLYLASGGHAGLLVSLVDALEQVPELYALIQKCQPLDWVTASHSLFRDDQRLFQIIQYLPFARGLPRQEYLQQHAFASVFKNAVAHNGTLQSSYLKNPDQQRALEDIWKQGWLHAETVQRDTLYVFPSQIHRWYCQCLFSQVNSEKELIYSSPLEMAIDAIRKFDPCQLSSRLRTLEGDPIPIEDQYQKEFYRCLFPLLLEYQIKMAPEYLIKSGVRSGRIDFLIEQKRWGLELLRNSNRVRQHMQRFKKDGQYFTMLNRKLIQDYVVLNFTRKMPQKSYAEYRGHLYHVVFSEDFRIVRIIDASDLSEVTTLVLVENPHFLR
ncbi:uncharacterized protein BO66DRAFT_445672 [Aspergillus aculeatinus CBS 121060]|uniref:Uncharacterized protein n=1 Tax=Aspergillus aculeatinus CBS 121060 TaxID=1448322 RepID=A0ACD1HPT1_9EURO|nr:hypothetical protein BO66DRAFT_445672 [Aspergillus aculeatinus CBS 121060]RAH75635.1 hypothetical protein BO66DRAFT_445672 [Aspergillus aculeatinus CBS 121060]